MRSALSLLLGIGFISIFGTIFLLHSQNASAATTHLVISEIQIAGVSSSNDFIEIYNPTPLSISLDGYRLGKKTSGTTSASFATFTSTASIPAHGYFLWCNSSLSSMMSCDASNSGTITNDNSISLINGSLAEGTVVDAVTFGTPGSTFGEGTSLLAPEAPKSVERKANSLSTALSMAIGGVDEFNGNSEDTNNNSSDFIVRDVPQPQNSTSISEFLVVSPTPTTQPSNTPTPTITPTSVPSIIPTTQPNPSVIPTTTPTIIPSSIPSPIPTTPPSPTPTPGGGKIIVKGPLFTCTLHHRPWKIFGKIYFFPFVICTHNSI